jgi:hypothetical protein
MNSRFTIISGLICLLAASAAQSETFKHFPGATIDQRTLRAADRVEALYDDGDYKRAMLIYEKDLAPLGDKYAQYMVGYMHLSGKSVPADKAKALAWYRLAAERGEAALTMARDTLRKSMTDDELAQSHDQFIELWKKLGDTKLILDLIRKDLKDLGVRTGSRIPGANSGRLTIVSMTGEDAGNEYYEHLRDRINNRLEYLDSTVGIVDIDVDDEDIADIKALEMEMRAEVAALDAS